MRYQVFIPGVADGDQDIADKAVALDTFDGGAGVEGAECGVIEGDEVCQGGAVGLRTRVEFDLFGGLREFVPRTDGKTVITTINAICLLYTSPSPRDRG